VHAFLGIGIPIENDAKTQEIDEKVDLGGGEHIYIHKN
jgi:hypothetical protein